MKTTEPFHLHFATDDIKETGRKKNQGNLFESDAIEVYLVDSALNPEQHFFFFFYF